MCGAANKLQNEFEFEMQPISPTRKGPDLVEREMGIHRRRRRSLHGRDFLGKIPEIFNSLSPAPVYASCLEINDESVLHTIMDGCINVEDMIKKLKEQTISLNKKRCIKAKLKPVTASKLVKIGFAKKLKYRICISYGKLKLGFRNFLYSFELWYSSLKMIEGKFGSSVATYFKFLRKLFILNCIIFSLNFFFIILPQILYVQWSNRSTNDIINDNANTSETNNSYTSTHKIVDVESNPYDEEVGIASFFFLPIYTDVQNTSFRLGNIFTGTICCVVVNFLTFVSMPELCTVYFIKQGYLTDSVLFYGHYFNSSFSLSPNYAYDMPSAYFFSTALCYLLMLCVLFFSVAESYKKCYIETSNGIKNVFAEKIFCGWDFGIAKPDAEELKYCTIYMELKELLNESNGKKGRSTCCDKFYTVIIRMSLNTVLLLLFVVLGWCTYTYLDRHMDSAEMPTLMMLMLTLTLVTTIAPVCFSQMEKIEFYDCPRSAMYVTLIRTFILHILIIQMIVAHRLSSASKITCWETIVGQDIYRLLVLDFIVGVGDNMVEFIRSRMSRIWNRIHLPEFNIALNTMNLIYNQALLYVGLYFSPGISLLVALKMLLTFYMKKWGAMYNCRPSKRPWRAAQMQTVFLSFAFLVFFGVIIGYGYIFTSVKTSSCGPFGGRKYTFQAVLYEILHEGVNSKALLLLSHFLRSGMFIIVLLAMVLAIYYLRTVNSVRRHIVKNLRLIVKEQVAYKKKLLMKINKAGEFKHGMRNNNKNRPSSPNNSVSVNEEDKESSLDSDNNEDLLLNSRAYDVGERRNLRNENSISRSLFNVRDLRGCDNLSEETVISFKSLQNLVRDCRPEDSKEYSKNFRRLHRVKSDEGRNEYLENSAEEDDKPENSMISSQSDEDVQPLKENHEFDRNESTCFNRRAYNCDDRMPSRIYFSK